MKKIIIGFILFLISALIIELLIKYITKDDPNIHERLISMTYSKPDLSKKIGKLEAFTIDYTLINLREDSVSFIMEIQGTKSSISFTGITAKIKDKWEIIKVTP